MIYLDEVKWQAGGDESFYFHPEMKFDLRNLASQGVPGLTAGRFVVCEGPVVPVGAIALGDPGDVLTLGRRAALGGVVGEAVPAIRVAEAVERIAVNWTDVTGQTRCRPVRVGRGMRLKFKIGSVEVNRVVQQADSEWQSTLAIERQTYAGWRQQALAAQRALQDAGRTWEQVLARLRNQNEDALDKQLFKRGDPDRHRRNLDYLVRKYGVPHTDFLGGLPDEGTLPHRTIFSDNFNRTDEALGTSVNWTELDGGWAIVSNQVQGPTTAGLTFPAIARCDSAVSSTDHYAQVDVVSDAPDSSASHLPGTAVRVAAATEDYYHCDSRELTGSNDLNIRKVVITVATILAGTDQTDPVFPYALKLQVNGSGLEVFVAAISRLTVTDTAITTGTLTGITNHNADTTTGTFDNFVASDLDFDLDRIERRTMRGHLRGVMRGT